MSDSAPPAPGAVGRKDRTHYLYIAVVVAVVLGILVGLVAPDFAMELKPLGTAFVGLIKMMISPVIFCTIVLGVGSVRKAARVGKVGGLALGYFLIMSTVALAIGLVVGNIIHPGSGLHLTARRTRRRPRGRGRGRPGRLPARHHPDHAVLPAGRRRGAVRRCWSRCWSASRCRRMGRPGSRSLRGVGHSRSWSSGCWR